MNNIARQIELKPADIEHLDDLTLLEKQCFATDQLSRRSLRRFLLNERSVFLVALENNTCVGYILIIFHRGTGLARLYSIAVAPNKRRCGIGQRLMHHGESLAQERGALYLRLEVGQTNLGAIAFYHQSGFKDFGLLADYYDDHQGALRMQKRIRLTSKGAISNTVPWYQQSTPFTCGPAALMMGIASLKKAYKPDLGQELELWREATTIFMTSGHGGCHPLGLALSAKRRGVRVQVWISQNGPLFVDSVRHEEKKQVIEFVHQQFVKAAEKAEIDIFYQNIDQQMLVEACQRGAVPLVLISTYRMDRKKSPHWVVVTGYDERCFYVHDPDPDEKYQEPLDCQHLPIGRENFDKMSSFGSSRLRTAVILSL